LAGLPALLLLLLLLVRVRGVRCDISLFSVSAAVVVCVREPLF